MADQQQVTTKRAKVLLDQAKLVVEKHESMARKQGLMFNLFEILDRQHDEVKGHSAFIAELLNPNGRHGQDDTFLRLFLERLQQHLKGPSGKEYVEDKDEDGPDSHESEDQAPSSTLMEFGPAVEAIDKTLNSDMKNAQIFVERAFNNASSTDGRIDILCVFEKLVMVIENKVWAQDQDSQLWRYNDYVRKTYKTKTTLLVYLSPYGHAPEDCSLACPRGVSGEELSPAQIALIDYQTFVRDWIEACIEKVPLVAQVRESLHQYWQTILQITGQGWIMDMTIDLMELLKKGDNLVTAQKLTEPIKRVRIDLELAFWKALESAIKERWTGNKDKVNRVGEASDIDKLITPGRKKDKYPSINVPLMPSKSPGIDIALDISMDSSDLYASVGFRDSERNWVYPKNLSEETVKAAKETLKGSFSEWKPTSYCLGWSRLKEKKNLRGFGPEIAELLKEDNLGRFVAKVAEEFVDRAQEFKKLNGGG